MTSAGLGWGSAAQCTAVRVVTSDRLHSLVSCTHQHLLSHNCGLTNSNKIPLLYNSDCYNSSKILQVKFQVWLQWREEPHFRTSAWSVPLPNKQTPVTLCCIIYGQEQVKNCDVLKYPKILQYSTQTKISQCNWQLGIYVDGFAEFQTWTHEQLIPVCGAQWHLWMLFQIWMEMMQ